MNRIENCIDCGHCKVHCPYELDTPKLLKYMLEDYGYSRIIVVGQRKDAVDVALIDYTEKGDIVVTQDYGVASMALGKQCY